MKPFIKTCRKAFVRLYLNYFKNCVLKKKSNFEILLIEISGLASNSRVYTPLENSDHCILARKFKKKKFWEI